MENVGGPPDYPSSEEEEECTTRGGWQGGSQKIRTEAEAILRSENV
jgi:hypothetical protein